MVGLPNGKKTLRICVTVYTQYRHVTDEWMDGQTDRQISCHSIDCAMHMRRVVKTKKLNCCRETARYLVSLKMSRSLKVIQNDTLKKGITS